MVPPVEEKKAVKECEEGWVPGSPSEEKVASEEKGDGLEEEVEGV